MRYRIGEFARLSGASIKALRFYDRLGILKPAAVDVLTGYRLYEARQLQDITTIFALKELGASLAEIRRVLSRARDPSERRRLLELLRSRALASIDTARRSLQWIELALAEAETANAVVPVTIKHRPQMRVASIRTTLKTYGEVDEVERELRRAMACSEPASWAACCGIVAKIPAASKASRSSKPPVAQRVRASMT
jgi:DNA-binding transcriptional MerR regulator